MDQCCGERTMLRLAELDVRSLGPIWSAMMARESLNDNNLRQKSYLIRAKAREAATPPPQPLAQRYICCCLP
jgi:hypothetical protein